MGGAPRPGGSGEPFRQDWDRRWPALAAPGYWGGWGGGDK